MTKQKTLKAPFSLSGKGLHTGLDIQITFLPAPAGTGRVIRRVDLEALLKSLHSLSSSRVQSAYCLGQG